jgi:phage FluMu gp28-like protein
MTTQLPDAKLFSFGEHESESTPAVLLGYQQTWVADKAEVKIGEKSRRIGLTWGEAADDVLVAATEGRDGMDVLYIGYNQEMTREYIQTCAWWANSYNKVCTEIEEFIFDDPDPEKNISAFRITFKSGHEIVALSSRPTNLRGRQGRVVIDEAAFHDDLPGLMKAALALLMWGGQVVVISTHFGDDNYFNTLIQDCRSGKLPYSVHRIDFNEALEDGLFRRICLVRGEEWSQEAEDAWRAKIVASYAEDADEELFCVPSSGTGTYLTRNMIEAVMDPAIPVIRWEPPAKDFVDWPLDRAMRETRDWCEEHLEPLLAAADPTLRSYLGQDFGRSGDLSVLHPAQEAANLDLKTLFVLELRNCPFRTQRQILFYILDRLPRFSRAAMDARGNGQALAEETRQAYGASRVEEVMLSETWYRENMPKLKAQFEDRTWNMPKDSLILDDYRALKVVRGVARVPDARTQDKGGKRHGDAAIAGAMLVHAVKLDGGPVEYAYQPVRSENTMRTRGKLL